jgi:hypothetical protein
MAHRVLDHVRSSALPLLAPDLDGNHARARAMGLS